MPDITNIKINVTSVSDKVRSVQFSSVAQSYPTLSDPMNCNSQTSMSITICRSLTKFMSIESVMPSNHIILCHSLLSPSIFPIIRVFSNESVLCIRQPKYWSSSFNISPSNEHSGQISFRMDWLDLLAIQGTLKSSLYEFLDTERGGSPLFCLNLRLWSHPNLGSDFTSVTYQLGYFGQVA